VLLGFVDDPVIPDHLLERIRNVLFGLEHYRLLEVRPAHCVEFDHPAEGRLRRQGEAEGQSLRFQALDHLSQRERRLRHAGCVCRWIRNEFPCLDGVQLHGPSAVRPELSQRNSLGARAER
jgi:hypothetical protein